MDFSEIDKKTFLFLNGIHNAFFDIVMNWLSNLLLWIPLSLFIAYVLIKNFNLKSKTSLILNILLVLLFAFFQFLICVKLTPSFVDGVIHRVRPCYDPYISTFIHFEGNDSGRFGFFASRACLAFSVGTFLYFALWEKHKSLKITFIVLAILISYSRIYLGLQYPANILVSAVTGILIGTLSYPFFFFIKNSVSTN